jgi:predicted MFS family arabinose efflux permease
MGCAMRLIPMPSDAFTRIGRMGRLASTPPLSRYLAGHAAASMGEWMKRATLGWLIWDVTGSATWLGALSFAVLGPSVLGAIWGGALADRRDRRALIAMAKAVDAGLALIVAVMVISGWPDPTAVVALAAGAGLVGGLAQAAGKTIISDLVSPATLPNAVALNATVFNLATLTGPTLAAALILGHGVVPALVVAGLGLGLHAVLVMTLPGVSRPARAPAHLHYEIAAGIGAVIRSSTLRPLMALHAACAMLVRPFLDMAPALSTLVLGRGPDGIAMITTGVGAGAIAGGLWLASRDSAAGLPRIVVSAAITVSVAAMAFTFVPGAIAAIAVAGLIGFASILRAAGIQTLLQLGAEAEVRGRVLGLYGMLLHLGGAIGGLLIGLMTDAWGITPALMVAGGTVLALTAAIGPRVRSMRLPTSQAANEGQNDDH